MVEWALTVWGTVKGWRGNKRSLCQNALINQLLQPPKVPQTFGAARRWDLTECIIVFFADNQQMPSLNRVNIPDNLEVLRLIENVILVELVAKNTGHIFSPYVHSSNFEILRIMSVNSSVLSWAPWVSQREMIPSILAASTSIA